MDVEEEQCDKVRWSWENCVGALESVIIEGEWVRLYNSDGDMFDFACSELKHVIKALQNAEKWFEENV